MAGCAAALIGKRYFEEKIVFFGPKIASFWTFLVKNYFPLPKISQKWLRLYLKWFSTIFTSWFFEGKTQKLENTFFESFAIFYLEFPSTQSKTIFEKIFENSLIFETFHGEKILENSKKWDNGFRLWAVVMGLCGASLCVPKCRVHFPTRPDFWHGMGNHIVTDYSLQFTGGLCMLTVIRYFIFE